MTYSSAHITPAKNCQLATAATKNVLHAEFARLAAGNVPSNVTVEEGRPNLASGSYTVCRPCYAKLQAEEEFLQRYPVRELNNLSPEIARPLFELDSISRTCRSLPLPFTRRALKRLPFLRCSRVCPVPYIRFASQMQAHQRRAFGRRAGP